MTGASSARLGGTSISWRAWLVALLGAALLPLAAPPAAAAPPRPIPPPFQVTITDTGFHPATIDLAVGQTLWVDNASSGPQSLTADDGWIDSGAIPVGGRFVLTATSFGAHSFASTTTPTSKGTIVIGLLELPGNGSSPARPAVPDGGRPSTTVDVHPGLGLLASRNRALVLFTASATVDQANQALADAGVVVVGGLRRFGIAAVEVPDNGVAGDFGPLTAALASLRANPAVQSAALDLRQGEASLPRPTDPDPSTKLPPPDPKEAPPPPSTWRWDAMKLQSGGQLGTGGNWGLEASGFPATWNLLERIKAAGAPTAQTVVIDSGFDSNRPELVNATLRHLCTDGVDGPPVCTDDPLSHPSHGTSTASVIGAAYDAGPKGKTSTGVVGGNPVADLFMIPVISDADNGHGSGFSLYSLLLDLSLVLQHKSVDFPYLHAVNLSLKGVIFDHTEGVKGHPVWEAAFAGKLCGPDAGDDATPAAVQTCTPENADQFLDEVAKASELYRPVFEQYAAANVLIVQSAGNDSGPWNDEIDWCVPAGVDPCKAQKFHADRLFPMAYLAHHWPAGQDPPYLSVEAYNAVMTPGVVARDGYSNIGGDIAAPGYHTLAADDLPPGSNYGYTRFAGTSAAAPFVTALAGYLWAINPSLTYNQVRRAIIDNGRIDVEDGTDPLRRRMDAFRSVLSLPGVVDKLVDVNDSSPDGNRRVVLGDGNEFLGYDEVSGVDGARTAPDHDVDLRDLRRFRDAFLESCIILQGGLDCPLTAAISLDGKATNPKTDLNLDGCTFIDPDPVCTKHWNDGLREDVWPRVDFNGDGTLAKVPNDLPLASDGTPLAGSTTAMTDLDVLATRWGTGPHPETGGWTAAQLPLLLRSADFDVRVDDLFAQGASSVTVQALYGPASTPAPPVTHTEPGPLLVTVPLGFVTPEDPDADLVLIKVTAAMPDGPREFVSKPQHPKVGFDKAIRPCANRLEIDALRNPIIVADSTLVTAAVTDCKQEADTVGDIPVTFSLVGDAHGASLVNPDPKTDASGSANVYLQAGGQPGAVTVRVTMHGAKNEQTREVVVDVQPKVEVFYRWRQTLLQYDRHSTNDWGAGEDDCDGPNDHVAPDYDGCFSSDQTMEDPLFDGEVYAMERQGSLVSNGTNGVTVNERGRMGGYDGSSYSYYGDPTTTNTVETRWNPFHAPWPDSGGLKQTFTTNGFPPNDYFVVSATK